MLAASRALSVAALLLPHLQLQPSTRAPAVRLALAPAELDVPRAAGSSASTALPPLFNKIEKALETVSKDPQALLEAVVGLPSGMATYDRERVTDYFQQRPALMVTRALDFLLAFRRVRAAWAAEGVDRGAVLRAELSALGPVAVKVGQTLSQRPDILPEDVCVALKSLQTSNKPFSNEEAYRVMAEDFGAKGPLAPGIPATEGCDPNGPTLFKRLSADCIASASLGQVYRGETHDGQEIAVKVQRPGALRQCLLDGSVIIVALKAIQGRYWNGDLLAIFDGVAAGIVQELDFRNEAANGDAFRSSLEFLGYVDVPRTIPELTTRRAMAMEWVRGRHLSDLSPEEAMRMTYMACEAVTAGLVLTGLVHADPHEGNIMLADDGRLVFLDFGLMSRVEPQIMEAFASGIQCVLSKDYVGLTQAFMDTGFVGDPIEWRAKESDPWQVTHPSGRDPRQVMADELRDRMNACPGGGSRFGAMSVVLGDMGFYWQMYTPPYIILLIRTFLTLEGIAGQVDPTFNIYEVALPWALERALSPATARAQATLRRSLLTEDHRFQWARVETLLEQQQAEAAAAAAAAAASECALPEATSARARLMAGEADAALLIDPALAAAGAEAQAAQAATPLDSLTKVLGSPSGSTLRRIMRDLDSTSLLLKLASPEARPVRRLVVRRLADEMESRMESRRESAVAKGVRKGVGEWWRTVARRCAALAPAARVVEGGEGGEALSVGKPANPNMVGRVVPTISTNLDAQANAKAVAAAPAAAGGAPVHAPVEVPASAVLLQPQPWPTSPAAAALVERAASRARVASRLLLRLHIQRQVAAGWRGAAAVGALAYVVARVAIGALMRVAIRTTAGAARTIAPRPVAVAVAIAATAVAAVLSRELSALGASFGKVAEEMEKARKAAEA